MRWTSLHLVLLVLAQFLFGNAERQVDAVDRLWFAQEPQTLRAGDVFVNWEENEKYERAYAQQRRRLRAFTDSRRQLFKRNQVSLDVDRTMQDLLGATLRKHFRRRRLNAGMDNIHRRFREKMHRARHTDHLSSADIGAKYENYGEKYEDTTRFRPLSSFHKSRKSSGEKKVSNCDESIKGDNGEGYLGCQEETVGGLPCQKWAAQNPHSHPFHPQVFMDKNLNHNYCRNPNGKRTIWCFTTDPKKRWDYCSPVDHNAEAQISSSRTGHRKRRHSRRRPRKRSNHNSRRRSRRKRKNLKNMDRADLEMEIRQLRGENRGIKKRLNHCPLLAFPDVVIDCGVYKKLEGNKRRCYGQDEGCVGAGWFSKVHGPPSQKHPSTVNAIAICRNQGYNHVDKVQFGGNFNIHCLYPGDRDDGKPNHKGGPLKNFGQTGSWRCGGHRACKSVIPKEGEVAGIGQVKQKDPNKAPQCPHLPRHVIDCGEYEAIGNDRECHKKGAGCVGTGWFSKKQGQPHTVNAIAICRNRGYDGVDPEFYGGNWDMHCRYPGSDRKSKPNHNGGSLNDFGRSVIWKCVGTPKCGKTADKIYEKIRKEHVAPPEPDNTEGSGQNSVATLVGAHSCQSKEISGLTKADGGLLWYNGEKLFYEGDNGVVVAQSPTLTGIHLYKDGHPENIIGDSQNGKMYRLCHDCGKDTNKPLLEHKSKTADTYVEINQLQCLEGGDDSMQFLANVNLPKSYYMRLPYFHAVGAGEVVFMDDHNKWHAMELTCSKTPTVKLLGENQGEFTFNKCGRGFATGVMEKVGDQYSILFFSSKSEISKKQIPAGDAYVMFTVPMHGTRECSFAVDYRQKLFFYHAQSIGGAEELLEFCVADVNKLDNSQQAAVSALDVPMEFTSGSVNVDGVEEKAFGDTGHAKEFQNIVQKVEDKLHLGLTGRRTMKNSGAKGEVMLSGTEGESKGNSFFEGIDKCTAVEMKDHIKADSGMTWTDGAHVFYQGSDTVARASGGTLDNMTKYATKKLENVIADPFSGNMYRLCFDCGLNAEKQVLNSQSKNMKVNELLCLNKELGGMKKVKLPKTMFVKFPYFHAVGNGEVAFMDDRETWYVLKLSCEEPVDMRILGDNEGDMAYRHCKSKYSSGVLEKEGQQYRVIYFSAKAQVSKKNIPKGSPASMFQLPEKESSDECSLAIDYARQKFYYTASGVHEKKFPMMSCPAKLRPESADQAAKVEKTKAQEKGDQLQKQLTECEKEKEEKYKIWREIRDQGYEKGTKTEREELHAAHKVFLEAREKFEAKKKELEDHGKDAKKAVEKAKKAAEEEKKKTEEKAKADAEKKKAEEKAQEKAKEAAKKEAEKAKAKTTAEPGKAKTTAEPGKAKQKADTTVEPGKAKEQVKQVEKAKEKVKEAKKEAEKKEKEEKKDVEKAKKDAEKAKADAAKAKADAKKAKEDEKKAEADAKKGKPGSKEAQQKAKEKKEEAEAKKDEAEAKKIEKDVKKMTKELTSKAAGEKKDVKKEADKAKQDLDKEKTKLKKIEDNFKKAEDPSKASGSSKMVKLDEWLKDHTKADGDYFRNEKTKIDAKLKEARAKIVALAGDPGNKAREEKIKLQERIMELEHEERLREMRERMILKLMHEHQKEKLRRWKSELKRLTVEDTDASKKRCAELRTKIRDAEMRMKMRDIKIRMMKKTEKLSAKLAEKKEKKEVKAERAKKKDEAEKKDKELKKTIKKAKKQEKKQLKKLKKKGISGDAKKKVKKSFEKVIKKLKKKDKKEKKILERTAQGGHKYKARLLDSETKIKRMHNLILYLQKELKAATGKDYKIKRSPKQRKKLKKEVKKLKKKLEKRKGKKKAKKKLKKLKKKLDKKLEKSIKKEKKKLDSKLALKEGKDGKKMVKAFQKAVKKVSKNSKKFKKKFKKLTSWYDKKTDGMSDDGRRAMTHKLLKKLENRIQDLAKEVNKHADSIDKLREGSSSDDESDKSEVRELEMKSREQRKKHKKEAQKKREEEFMQRHKAQVKTLKEIKKLVIQHDAKMQAKDKSSEKKILKKVMKDVKSSKSMKKVVKKLAKGMKESSVATGSKLAGRCEGEPVATHVNIITSSQCASKMKRYDYASFNAVEETCHIFENCDLQALQDRDDFITYSTESEVETAEEDFEDNEEPINMAQAREESSDMDENDFAAKKLLEMENAKSPDPEEAALENEIDSILADSGT